MSCKILFKCFYIEKLLLNFPSSLSLQFLHLFTKLSRIRGSELIFETNWNRTQVCYFRIPLFPLPHRRKTTRVVKDGLISVISLELCLVKRK